MNYIIDIIILLCVGWGAYKGFKKGFINRSFSVIAVAIGIWGGFTFAGKLVPFLKDSFLHIGDMASLVISFIIIFLIIMILLSVTGAILTKLIDVIALGMINRLAGAAFGILTNVLVLSIIILFFNSMNDKKQFIEPKTIEKTYLYEPIRKFAPTILPERIFTKLLD